MVAPTAVPGRTRSSTMPTVLAYLHGLCGVLPTGRPVNSYNPTDGTEGRTWKQEHFAFTDGDLAELAALDRDSVKSLLRLDTLANLGVVDDLEGHVALVLIEPFLLGASVTVSPGRQRPR